MPIYDYRCKVCDKVIEVIEARNSKEKHICSECKSEDMEKQASLFSFTIK